MAGALSWTSRRTAAQQTDNPLAAILAVDDSALTEEDDFFGVKGLDLRSHGRQMADSVRRSVQAGQLTLGNTSNSAGLSEGNRREDGDHGADDVQVNNPALDNIQTFAGTRPFEESTQSETSVIGAWGDNRRTWIGPPTSIFPGPHAQADVFFSGRARGHDSETDR